MSQESTQFAVQVTIIPGGTKAVLVDEGATVRDAIRAAGYNSDGHEVRVDGDVVGLSYELERGDEVTLAKMVKGN